MQKLINIILLLALVVLTSCIAADEYKCIEGKIYFKQSNTWVESATYFGKECKPLGDNNVKTH